MIIFIAGIHGVGKSYLSSSTANELGLKHATASQLIRDERGTQSWSENKIASDVDQNQLALISALDRLNAKKETLLLDGHFVIRINHEKYVAVDTEIFRRINPKVIVHLTAPLEIIFDRLALRNDNSWTLDELSIYADAETKRAEDISTALRIPKFTLNSPRNSEFKDLIKNLIENFSV